MTFNNVSDKITMVSLADTTAPFACSCATYSTIFLQTRKITENQEADKKLKVEQSKSSEK